MQSLPRLSLSAAVSVSAHVSLCTRCQVGVPKTTEFRLPSGCSRVDRFGEQESCS